MGGALATQRRRKMKLVSLSLVSKAVSVPNCRAISISFMVSIASSVLAPVAEAQDPGGAVPSPFEQEMNRLSTASDIETRESTVMIGGLQYKKIVVDNKIFYVQAAGRGDELREIHCGVPGSSRGTESPLRRKSGENLVEAGVQVTKRAKAFVSLLQESCTSEGGVVRSYLALEPEFGIKFKDDPNDKIKEKKLYVAPFSPGVGFSGEW